MKSQHCVTVIAMGLLLGCQAAGRHSSEIASTGPEPDTTVVPPPNERDPKIARIPAIEGSADEQSYVQLASHEVEPRQQPEDVVPEVLELPAASKPNRLTLQQLQQMALSHNPALAQAAGRVQALQGKWLQVGLYPNPTAGYAAQEIGDDGTAGKQGAFVSQEFVTGKKLHLNRAVVEQEIAQAEADYTAVEQRVQTDVQMAFYDVLLAQRRVEVARDLVAIAAKAVQASQDLFKAEEVGKAAVLQTQVELNSAEIISRQAGNARRAAWQRLTSVVGVPEMPLQTIEGDIEAAPVDYDFEETLQGLVSRSPQLAAAFASAERARWVLSRAEVEAIPNINTQVAVLHDNASGDDVAAVQVGVPLPIFDRNQGGIQQAIGEIVAAEQNRSRIELRLRNQLADVFRAYADARIQVEKYSREILPQAKETLQLTETGYRAGEMDFLSLLTAQRTYFQTNLAYLDALRQMWRRATEIEGLLLQGSLETDQ